MESQSGLLNIVFEGYKEICHIMWESTPVLCIVQQGPTKMWELFVMSRQTIHTYTPIYTNCPYMKYLNDNNTKDNSK